MRRRSCLLLGTATLLAGAGRPTRVRMLTSYGPILIEANLARAPLSSGAFLDAVAAHAYDGGAFTRTVRPGNDRGTPKIQLIQGAARIGTPAGPMVAHESTQQTGLHHLDGTISLPRDAVGTATGGEFFICIADQPGLDFGGKRNPDGQGFAAFGRVVDGMAVVRQIWTQAASGPSDSAYTVGQMLDPIIPIIKAS